MALGPVLCDTRLRSRSETKPSWHVINGLKNGCAVGLRRRGFGTDLGLILRCKATPRRLRSVAGARGRAAAELPRSAGLGALLPRARHTPFPAR